MVDAAHPFDREGARLAAATARRLGAPLVTLRRAPWLPGPGDRWRRVRSARAAALALPAGARRVFVALGRDQLAPFAGRPDLTLLVRARGASGPAQAPRPRLARARFLTAPGPYTPAGEARLFRALGVQALVARNAGGPDAWPKMAAARRLGLPVILLEPPPAPPGAVRDVPAALAALDRLARAAEG
ncbi:precorrin-6A/cobalt-precorrin-6A reductase [Oceanicella actignis]|uniref:precorrin-6A/cobalt-precorrin-6A reductase n=1 Tax=Oceanicella actignis TaxID=1189325 RepID=UPI0012573E27|nr:precorrin-6A/cobalt-precorrin-6A reductase [Oceanicella actignis]TYO89454.1 precorrin-6A/cobalt-precorrin-6A reductase [Oceanicella actignis]